MAQHKFPQLSGTFEGLTVTCGSHTGRASVPTYCNPSFVPSTITIYAMHVANATCLIDVATHGFFARMLRSSFQSSSRNTPAHTRRRCYH